MRDLASVIHTDEDYEQPLNKGWRTVNSDNESESSILSHTGD